MNGWMGGALKNGCESPRLFASDTRLPLGIYDFIFANGIVVCLHYRFDLLG